MIKAVIFDMGSVLTTDEWPPVYAKIADELKISKKKIRDAVKPLYRKWSAGKIDEADFWRKFRAETGVKLSLSEEFTKDFWFKTYKNLSKDIKESWEILTELKTKGFRLALLSNIVDVHFLANREMGRLDRLRDIGFEKFVWSFKEGVRKPDPKIYKAMLKKLNLPAEACVFIDDQLENIETAKKLGMKGIHFKTPEKLRKKLMKLGLL